MHETNSLMAKLQILEDHKTTRIRIEFGMASLNASLKLHHFVQKQIVCAQNMGETVTF